MSQTIRRFSTQGATGALRQLHLDERGTFMLHSDHLVAINQADKQAFELKCQLRHKEDELARLRLELEAVKAEVTAGRGQAHWWAVMHAGLVVGTYPSENLAAAAQGVYSYTHRTNKCSVFPLWEKA